jgi:ribosomal protein S21
MKIENVFHKTIVAKIGEAKDPEEGAKIIDDAMKEFLKSLRKDMSGKDQKQIRIFEKTTETCQYESESRNKKVYLISFFYEIS